VTIHLPKCVFKTNELPDWFNRYLASREQEFEQVEAQEAVLDDDLRDKINQDKVQPLAIRLYNAE
jgi:hypothetical protein